MTISIFIIEKSLIMNNQFQNVSLLVSNKPVQIDSKDQAMTALESKNKKLKSELKKIQYALSEINQSQKLEEQFKKRESIFESQQSIEILGKELTNAYKRIKMYEYEIGKMQNKISKGSVQSKSSAILLAFKEKQSMSQRLKLQFIKQQRLYQQNIKKLQNNNHKEQVDTYLTKLAQEIKFYKAKILFYQQKEALKQKNMRKQHEVIKKIENQLLQSGISAGQLSEIKQRAIKGLIAGKKQGQDGYLQDSKINKSLIDLENSQEQIQDKTVTHFQSLLNEINLLQKVRLDHEKQMIEVEHYKNEINKQNSILKNKIDMFDIEIQTLQSQIASTKRKITPMNLKPVKPPKSLSTIQVDKKTDKIKISKSVYDLNKSKSLIHLLKYDQVGMATSKGQAFTDRNILGKSNFNTKITSMCVYIDKNNNIISGLQCTYNGHKKGGNYVKLSKQSRQNLYVIDEYTCRQKSYISQIAGTLNQEDRLESLFIKASDGNSHKFGNGKTSHKSFTFQIGTGQFPVCLFGSLLTLKLSGKKEVSTIEHLGFEISEGKDGTVFNEFNE